MSLVSRSIKVGTAIANLCSCEVEGVNMRSRSQEVKEKGKISFYITDKYCKNSTEAAGVPHSNGTPLSDGRNAREAYPPNKLSINVDRLSSTHDIITP